MDAGKLNRYITIQSKTTSRSASGGVYETWSTLANVWANKLPRPGNEGVEADRQVYRIFDEWEIYYLSTVTPKCRFYDSDSGAYYNILSVEEIGYKEGMKLSTELIRYIT